MEELTTSKVEPDITKASDKGRQTKTLSGGEKSFSTICLLLSLWDAMGSPIRCLDEFDVFMDNVNRDVSMRMIVSVPLAFVFTSDHVRRSANILRRSKLPARLSADSLSSLPRKLWAMQIWRMMSRSSR